MQGGRIQESRIQESKNPEFNNPARLTILSESWWKNSGQAGQESKNPRVREIKNDKHVEGYVSLVQRGVLNG